MQISPLQNLYTNNSSGVNSPSFSAGGKPITLQYIVEKRADLLPPRVLAQAKQLLKDLPPAKQPSLLQLHKELYAPLAECKTLDEAKALFPEFEQIKESVNFSRESVFSRKFRERTDKDFALKVLKDYWYNLKTKEEIAQDFGMPSRSSLAWVLEQINFVPYSKNYKILLRASDEDGNRIIASKTTAWNALHPDLMYKHNKQAAQGCKTDEYRTAQSARMKKYDIENPERREKISASLFEAWEKCPQIREALKNYIDCQPDYIRALMHKKSVGQITEDENIILKNFYKRFWDTYPEYKSIFAEARKKHK